MVTKWIKYRLALICKTRGKHRAFTITEYEPHEEITSLMLVKQILYDYTGLKYK